MPLSTLNLKSVSSNELEGPAFRMLSPGVAYLKVSTVKRDEIATYKVLVLVDESTQSQAEYIAMALRAAPRSMLVGSATAGADGNVSRLPLPGGLWSLMSGIGVYYPDKKPTQRVGLKPDVVARATIQGIGRGEDEVLAAALRQIIRGAGAEEKITSLSKRPVSESAGDAAHQ